MDEFQKQRAAKNEALFREVNEQVDRIDGERGVSTDDLTSFLCECAHADCMERVALTRSEYEAVRADPHQFILLAGHEEPEIERVVAQNDRYTVVEKKADRDHARATDPRS